MLASEGKLGYSWEDGLMFQTISDCLEGERKRLVIPKGKRARLITLAHDKLGHVGTRRTRES